MPEEDKEKLIGRCRVCNYCPLEDILTIAQRKRKVLLDKVPTRHISRRIIEEICWKEIDEVCELKYAAERLHADNRHAVQSACVGIYLWDLRKGQKREVEYLEGFRCWNNKKNFGRFANGKMLEESYAGRFREVWDLGLRGDKQSISALNIYESVVSSPEVYNLALGFFGILKSEHLRRSKEGLEQ